MKLFYSPGACSLAVHITLEEIGKPYQVRTVKTPDGKEELLKHNPRGAVPTLVTDDGKVLTETAAILQYLADQAPEKKLFPASGWERYRALEALNFIATELHKTYGPLFAAGRALSEPAQTDKLKAFYRERLGERFQHFAAQFGEGFFLGSFSVIDAYAATVLQWTRMVGMELDEWPKLKAYVALVGQRPSVKAALQAEGLGPWN
jgi:glutathione S-transferase